MKETNNLKPEEIIEFIIKKIHQIAGPGVTRSTALKALYLLTKNLKSENEITMALPFYWFYKGPISDTFQDVHYKMEIDGKITGTSPGEDSSLYFCQDKKTDIKLEEKFKDEIKILTDILKKYYDTEKKDASRLIELCYKHAPNPFMAAYNSDFRENYNNLYRALLHDKHLDKWKEYLPLTIVSLENCQMKLINCPEYKEFNLYFNIFVRCFKQGFLSNKIDENIIIKKIFSTHTKELRDDIWMCFEEIYRCINEGHDPKYNNQIEGWKLYAEDMMIILGQYINFYYDFITKNIGWNENIFSIKELIKQQNDHIPPIELIWMAKDELLPGGNFKKNFEHLKSGCVICKTNLDMYKSKINTTCASKPHA